MLTGFPDRMRLVIVLSVGRVALTSRSSRVLWFRSNMYPESLLCSEVKLLESDWIVGMLHSSVS